MANYCYTNLYVYGPQEELANLFKKLKRWTRKDERKPKSAFGCGWLGFIAEGAGLQAFDLRAGVEKSSSTAKDSSLSSIYLQMARSPLSGRRWCVSSHRAAGPATWRRNPAQACTLPTIN